MSVDPDPSIYPPGRNRYERLLIILYREIAMLFPPSLAYIDRSELGLEIRLSVNNQVATWFGPQLHLEFDRPALIPRGRVLMKIRPGAPVPAARNCARPHPASVFPYRSIWGIMQA